MKFSLHQRIAITECLKVSELCAASKIEAVQMVGLISLKRARRIWRGKLKQRVLTDAEVQEFVDMVEGWTAKPRKATKR